VMVLSYGKPGHQGQLEGLGTIVLFASRGLLLGTRAMKFLLATVSPVNITTTLTAILAPKILCPSEALTTGAKEK
jgi:hypothetical protein